MRLILLITFSVFLLFGQAIAAELKQAKGEAINKEKVSYSLGYSAGRLMRKSLPDMDPAVYSKAFSEGFAGKKAAMSDKEMREAMRSIQDEATPKHAEKKRALGEKNKQLAEKNKKDGQAFLAENSGKEGVVTLPSGLQYRIIKEGIGRQPTGTDKVKVHYRGTLIDGKEFDSSFKRGKAATFGIDKVIKGWTEALMLMKEGAKWMLYIPSNLAYGEKNVGAVIGPNATLIFEVELIAVQ